MKLIFRTPSKSCGARVFNGAAVVVCEAGRYRKKVRRLGGRYANVLLVTHADTAKRRETMGLAWWAIEDELFIRQEDDT